MFPEPIKKVLWKAVLAKGCFCFHKIKLPQPDGLSAISFNHHQWLRLTDMPSCEPASSVVAAKPRCGLSRKISLSELVKNLKTSSSKILKGKVHDGFSWQNGYGPFSVSQSASESFFSYF